MELQGFGLKFEHTDNIKSQALADFTAEWTEIKFDDPEEETCLPGKEDPDAWTMHFDGSNTRGQGGADVILTSPTGDRLKYVVQMHYQGNMVVYKWQDYLYMHIWLVEFEALAQSKFYPTLEKIFL